MDITNRFDDFNAFQKTFLHATKKQDKGRHSFALLSFNTEKELALTDNNDRFKCTGTLYFTDSKLALASYMAHPDEKVALISANTTAELMENCRMATLNMENGIDITLEQNINYLKED